MVSVHRACHSEPTKNLNVINKTLRKLRVTVVEAYDLSGGFFEKVEVAQNKQRNLVTNGYYDQPCRVTFCRCPNHQTTTRGFK